MKRRDWLLLFAAYEGAPDGLDPVRLQKGLFLFAMRATIPKREKYTFKPYDYGPMSAAIYTDLDALVDEGLLKSDPIPGRAWSRYSATEAGLLAAGCVIKDASEQGKLAAAKELFAVKQTVASLSFNRLLEAVYREHPEYAVNSVFRRTSD